MLITAAGNNNKINILNKSEKVTLIKSRKQKWKEQQLYMLQNKKLWHWQLRCLEHNSNRKPQESN